MRQYDQNYGENGKFLLKAEFIGSVSHKRQDKNFVTVSFVLVSQEQK